MSNKHLMVIFVISLYLIVLLISGLLAFMYHVKHKPFMNFNKKFHNEVIKTFNDFVLKNNLTPVKGIFETKIGEDILLVQKMKVEILQKSKKEIKKSQKDIDNNIFNVMKSSYKLFNKPKKIFFDECSVFLSNKRLVIKIKDDYKIISLDKVLICSFYTLQHIGELFKTLLIETQEEKLIFIVEELRIGIMINKMLGGSNGQKRYI
ncbi:hypothetical protein EELLY_v1c02140 [Entomoplasma ellychniae]|uniref:Uncharacterized protein n=1 Tax=Entomoplasma ellychniae TaxID=2114 RepID=A0A8E2QY09_9MOLU|nr:hypothetical protein [Entomoplasma ellychniae]PPE04534.1 hypothetical protein EELLY_v1c02140 [Entomoplasma ellychniae]